MIKYFSMFSGIGGFEIGIQRAYDDATGRRQSQDGGESLERDESMSIPASIPWEQIPLCIGYSEIDKYAIKVYERNFNGHTNYKDATKINPEELPDFDLLVGGFPCQAFSIAGKRKGFEDTRGTLFFDIARILAEKKPKHLVLENVKGLLSHDQGRTFQTIIGVLSDLGYGVEWQVLNSKDFGVPQNRERVIIVGHLGNECGRKVFPITNGSKSHLKYSGGVISSREKWLEDGNNNSRNFSQGQRIYSTEGISQTLAGQAEGQGGKTGLYEIADTRIRRLTPKVAIQEATKKGYAEATVGQAINLSQPNSKTRRGRVSDIAQTIDTGMQQHTLTEEARIRRLTPKECERLQGFPDDWTKYGEDEHGMRVDISDTQRYKMCGNAVTTNVIQAVITNLIKCMEEI